MKLDSFFPQVNYFQHNFYRETDYLAGSLTRRQEIALFKRFYAGDQEARQTILESCLRWVIRLATSKTHPAHKHLLDEVIAEANEGLREALDARRFNPKRGRFITYATPFIVGRIYAIFRVQNAVVYPPPDNKYPNRVPFDLFEHLEDCPTEIQEVEGTPNKAVDEILENAVDKVVVPGALADYPEVQRILDTLPREQQEALVRHFVYRESVTALANEWGCHRQWIYKLLNKGLTTLRKELKVYSEPVSPAEEATA